MNKCIKRNTIINYTMNHLHCIKYMYIQCTIITTIHTYYYNNIYILYILNCSGEQRNTYLMEAQIPITNTTDCKYLYNKNNVVIDDKIIICGGHPEGGKDACRVISSFKFIL